MKQAEGLGRVFEAKKIKRIELKKKIYGCGKNLKKVFFWKQKKTEKQI